MMLKHKLAVSFITLTLLGLSCNSNRPNARNVVLSGQNAGGNSDTGNDDLTEDTEINKDGSVNLELVPDYGSKLRFMNGRALTVVYGRVFKEDANGFAHCAKDKPQDYTGCSLIFNAEERASMGLFDLYSERMKRGVQNVAPAENLTLNYMRNLRAALGRECTRLVAKETQAPSSSNFFVKDTALTATDLEGFVRKILDVNDKQVNLEMPFADYVKAFQTASTMGDAAKAKSNAYINLCISLAMDPQIFMY